MIGSGVSFGMLENAGLNRVRFGEWGKKRLSGGEKRERKEGAEVERKGKREEEKKKRKRKREGGRKGGRERKKRQEEGGREEGREGTR